MKDALPVRRTSLRNTRAREKGARAHFFGKLSDEEGLVRDEGWYGGL
jgi:hypothetical protein